MRDLSSLICAIRLRTSNLSGISLLITRSAVVLKADWSIGVESVTILTNSNADISPLAHWAMDSTMLHAPFLCYMQDCLLKEHWDHFTTQLTYHQLHSDTSS